MTDETKSPASPPRAAGLARRSRPRARARERAQPRVVHPEETSKNKTRAARRFGEPNDFALLASLWSASDYFSSASSDFKVLGAFFCNLQLATLSFLRLVSRRRARSAARPCTTSCGFEELPETIPVFRGRGFNLFKPLQRHFRATFPFLPSGPPRAVHSNNALGERSHFSCARGPLPFLQGK